MQRRLLVRVVELQAVGGYAVHERGVLDARPERCAVDGRWFRLRALGTRPDGRAGGDRGIPVHAADRDREVVQEQQLHPVGDLGRTLMLAGEIPAEPSCDGGLAHLDAISTA